MSTTAHNLANLVSHSARGHKKTTILFRTHASNNLKFSASSVNATRIQRTSRGAPGRAPPGRAGTEQAEANFTKRPGRRPQRVCDGDTLTGRKRLEDSIDLAAVADSSSNEFRI